MFESKNKYFGRKKGKSFLRLEQYTKYLLEPKKTLFNKIKTPRILEIGIGDGEKISEDAKSNSKVNFIGCDIFADGVLRAIRNSVDYKLKNLQVFHLNIQELLPLMPDNYFEEIRIYFPDPWPKNRHKKRRTVNQTLVKDLTKKLKKKGFIRFATDHGDYFIEALALMKKFKYTMPNISPKSWEYSDSNALHTKFEKKALDKNHKLFYFSVLKNY